MQRAPKVRNTLTPPFVILSHLEDVSLQYLRHQFSSLKDGWPHAWAMTVEWDGRLSPD